MRSITSTARGLFFLGFSFIVPSVLANLVEYEFNIRTKRSRPPFSPDCFIDRDMLLVEDMNPGPIIRANLGDTVKIKWINHSPSEGVSIHHHGLHMKGQPYVDGTGTVNTCVVGPMQSFVQTFVADYAGTHYWHGHTSLDRLDGLQGALIVDDPDNPEEQALKELYDEERIIFLQDWYHKSGPSIRTGLDSEPFIWKGNAQSFLINGKGRYANCVSDSTNPLCDPNGCSIEDYLSSIRVEKGKTYLFRIINGASLVAVNFAIASHNMTIVRADGTYVEPMEVRNLDIVPAQRYSVLVKADQEIASYWMATNLRHRTGVQGHAYLQYGDSGVPPSMLLGPFPEHIEGDDMDAGLEFDAALVSKNISVAGKEILKKNATRSIVFVGTQTRLVENNLLRWAVNNVSNVFSSTPLITKVYDAVNEEGALSWPDTDIEGTITVPDTPPVTWNYTEKLQDEGVSIYHDKRGVAIYKFVNGDIVDMVLQNVRALNGVPELHSWHLHGHSLYVLGQGKGVYDPNVHPKSFNYENPLLRDTISVWPNGWTAVRFEANNDGVWAFHCAMTAHAAMGMGFNVITSPDKLSPPPPGLISCTKTSVDPSDAEVCTSVNKSEESNNNNDETSGSTSSASSSTNFDTCAVLPSALSGLLYYMIFN